MKNPLSYLAVRAVLYFCAGLGLVRAPVYLSPARGLTEGEKTELKAVYGNSVDVERIRISRSAAGDLSLKLRGAAMETVNSRILVKRGNYSADYSKEKSLVGIRLLFNHEAAHVWQGQNCPTLYASALANIPYRLFNPHAPYQTAGFEKRDKDLMAYGMEQQAEILALYTMTQNIARLVGQTDPDKLAQARRKIMGTTVDKFVQNPAYLRQQCRIYGLPKP